MSRFDYGIACALEDVPDQWPIALRGDIEEICLKAKRYGYKAIELQLCNPDRYDWNNLKSVANQMGLYFSADATGREIIENRFSLISDDAGLRKAAIDRLKVHIDMCASLDCILIEGSMRSNIPSDDKLNLCLERLDEATYELSDYAKEKGVLIVIENITSHISNYLCSIFQVADYVEKIDRDNVGIHMDTYSMLYEDNDIMNAVRYCGNKLWYMHYSDSNRMYPGGGNVDFKKYYEALIQCKYNRVITIESRPYPTPDLCAEYGIKYLKALETVVEIENLSKTRDIMHHSES